ncbi:MAG: Na+/H+ antiporter NhaC family protein, partial [Oscillospiraceae bacterium]|nr:Na+/H+ antiporter NhaC family protein [Oscillospiraceae bacterium]
IMATAGAHTDHVNHESTQLPYEVTVAVCCALGYFIDAFTTSLAIILPAAIVLELILLFGIKAVAGKSTKA